MSLASAPAAMSAEPSALVRPCDRQRIETYCGVADREPTLARPSAVWAAVGHSVAAAVGASFGSARRPLVICGDAACT
jgi:hypothetical protein